MTAGEDNSTHCYTSGQADVCMTGTGWTCSDGVIVDTTKPTDCEYTLGGTYYYDCIGEQCSATDGWTCYNSASDSSCSSCADCDSDSTCDTGGSDNQDDESCVCSANNNLWFPGSITGSSGQCCGDDGINDKAMMQETLMT